MTDVDLKLALDKKTPAIVEYRFRGLSTSTKPTTLPDGSALPSGATYYETDIGLGYTTPQSFWWDGSLWNRIKAADPEQALLTQIVFLNAMATLVRQIIAEFRALKMTEVGGQFVETNDIING